MLALAELRIDAAIWQVSTVRLDEQDNRLYLAFDYADRTRIKQLQRMHGNQLRVVDESTAYWPLVGEEAEAECVLPIAKSVLRHA